MSGGFLGLDWIVWAVLVPAFFFFLWYDRRKKARYGDRATPGMIFVPVPGRPAPKRQNWVFIVVLLVAFGLFWHFVVDRPQPLPPPFPHLAPPAPGNR